MSILTAYNAFNKSRILPIQKHYIGKCQRFAFLIHNLSLYIL